LRNLAPPHVSWAILAADILERCEGTHNGSSDLQRIGARCTTGSTSRPDAGRRSSRRVRA
jgi:hypothetical protein